MSRPSLRSSVKTCLILLLSSCLMVCNASSTGPAESASGAVHDSGAESKNFPTASATLGPEGGSLELEDGTAFVVPAGALSEDVKFVLREVDEVETPFDDNGL